MKPIMVVSHDFYLQCSSSSLINHPISHYTMTPRPDLELLHRKSRMIHRSFVQLTQIIRHQNL